MNSSQKYISQTIAGLLSAKGKTRSELASSIGIQRRALYDRLANRTSWTIDELDIAATFLGYENASQLVALASSQQKTESRFFGIPSEAAHFMKKAPAATGAK